MRVSGAVRMHDARPKTMASLSLVETTALLGTIDNSDWTIRYP